jgi:hypothetical protein
LLRQFLIDLIVPPDEDGPIFQAGTLELLLKLEDIPDFFGIIAY